MHQEVVGKSGNSMSLDLTTILTGTRLDVSVTAVDDDSTVV